MALATCKYSYFNCIVVLFLPLRPKFAQHKNVGSQPGEQGPSVVTCPQHNATLKMCPASVYLFVCLFGWLFVACHES